MQYIQAVKEHTASVFELVQETVQSVYPKYYPGEVVDFFCSLHSGEKIAGDIENGSVGVLVEDGRIIGTGSHEGGHITRVYVLPECQGKGYGSFIMQCLEDTIAANYPSAVLDASLPACRLYEHRGYRTLRHERYPLDNGVVLVYEVMEKVS